MNYKSQYMLAAVLFTAVATYSLSGDAAEPALPEPATHISPMTTLGTKIQLSIDKCMETEQKLCIAVVIPFDVFKKAMYLLQLHEESI